VLGLESPSYERVDVDSRDVVLGCFLRVVLGLESPSYERVVGDSRDAGLGCFFEGGGSGWKARATKGLMLTVEMWCWGVF